MNPTELPALPEEREAALLARIAELERERDEALATVKALSLENSDMKDTLDVLGSAYGSEIERADRAELERNEALAQIERIRREAKRDGDSEAGCYLLAMFDNPCPANRALVAAFVHRSCGDPLESVQAKLDAMFDLVRAEERDRWEAAFEAARDAVLNRRGSMDGVGFSSEQIAAVLGTLDSWFVATRGDEKN